MQTVWGLSEKFTEADLKSHCVFYISVDTCFTIAHVLAVLEEEIYSGVQQQCEENAHPLRGDIARACAAFFRRCFFTE